MKVLYSSDPVFSGSDEPSIFLVGPTPRRADVLSWRPKAIEILERLKFSGTVLVPERQDWSVKFTYDDQVFWEQEGLFHCTLIAAWVPRDMGTMPALTTNVEFGYWIASDPKKLFYGRPDNAPSTRYLDWMYEEHTFRKPASTLETLLVNCLENLANLKEES
jgi:hypothetical protein